MTAPDDELRGALALTPDGDGVLVGTVHEGWDVFGITHGGYVFAMAGAACLAATPAPDLFTITLHLMRKAEIGPVSFRVTRVGGSRRFTTVSFEGRQHDRPVLAGVASVGDRGDVSGPTDVPTPWSPTRLAAGNPDTDAGFPVPRISTRFGMRMDEPTAAFARDELAPRQPLRAELATERPDQLTALLACDISPPAVWNTLGRKGWVPTLELTAHVRARPAPGPLRVEATTTHVTDGLLEEDALVHDATGALVVQSRQLALWTA